MEIVQRLVVETVQARLGDLTEDLGSRSGAATDKRVPAKKALSTGALREKGAKRTQAELEALTTRLAAYIAKNPGLRVEQINRDLGTSTKDLALPIKKLIADKVIKSKGAKRATAYFPVKG
ncbi:MAG: hypothetical protein H6806_10925 [Planctomycetes bacterium]|nr:hypothetical protein [Planctomycetota bacterium]